MDSVRARGMRSRETANTEEGKAETPDAPVFIEGGVIRKLWGVETHAYRGHLLRLDAESRRNRFCGTIADDVIVPPTLPDDPQPGPALSAELAYLGHRLSARSGPAR
jgi:hypothetical protein